MVQDLIDNNQRVYRVHGVIRENYDNFSTEKFGFGWRHLDSRSNELKFVPRGLQDKPFLVPFLPLCLDGAYSKIMGRNFFFFFFFWPAPPRSLVKFPKM